MDPIDSAAGVRPLFCLSSQVFCHRSHGPARRQSIVLDQKLLRQTAICPQYRCIALIDELRVFL